MFRARTELFGATKEDDLITIQASEEQHLQGIIELQQANLPAYLDELTMLQQGFVTVVHDYGILKSMNEVHQHAVALDDNKVVGYALAMDKSFALEIPFLVSLFDRINANLLKTNPNDTLNYIVMGQICIHKDYRSQGIFQKLFDNLRYRLSPQFNSIFTDIACKNTRSIRAHQKVGFESLEVFKANGEDWDIVEWKWAKN